MPDLSVIIPSYNCRYAAKTVQDILEKASGSVEVLVILDNYWPDPPIPSDKRVTVIHNGKTMGMRNGINTGVRMATGKYIMKSDDHCMFSPGFDKALIEHTEGNWVAVPSRFSLDPVAWEPKRAAVEYEYATYPYVYLDRFRYGCGLVAKKFMGSDGLNVPNMGYHEYYKKEIERRAIKIDDIMIFHGSCWFTTRRHFQRIGGLDESLFKTLYQEPQEISFKTWLSGGRVVVNKYAWYAHMFKGKDFGDSPNIRGYTLDLTAMRKTERFGTWYWMNDQWPGAKYPMKWLIEKFWPIPGWPANWEEEKVKWEKKYKKPQK